MRTAAWTGREELREEENGMKRRNMASGKTPSSSKMVDATEQKPAPSKRQRLSPQAKRTAAASAEPPAELPAFAEQPNGRHLQVGARSRGQLLSGGGTAPQQDASKRKAASTNKPQPPPLAAAPTSGAASAPQVPNGTASAAGPSNAAREELIRRLPLPDEYRKLQESFLAVDTTISFFRARGEPCFFQPLHRTVQINTQSEFSARSLASGLPQLASLPTLALGSALTLAPTLNPSAKPEP